MIGIKPIVMDGIFSKGVVQDKGEYTMDTPFSPAALNIRIVNGNTTLRNGYVLRCKDDANITKIPQGMTSLDKVYLARNSKLQYLDTTNQVYVDVPTATFSGDYKVEFFTYGKFLVALTGQGFPYVLNTSTGAWSQLTSTNIETGANPFMGTNFLYGSYIAGGTNSDILYMSRGATKANPEYVYDWAGTGAEQLQMKGQILGMVATLSKLYIWTSKGIEYLSKDTVSTVGTVTTTMTVPLSGENQPASQRSIVVADDLVFFLTKTLQVKSLNYTPGVTDPQVGNISERPAQSIRQYFDQLETDQSASFGYYNKSQRTVTWYLKRKGSFCNDTCLVYDIINDSFLIDSNKIGGCGTYFNGSYYIGSNLNSYTYETDIGYDDDGASIGRYRYTKRFNFGSPNKRKTLREVGTVGQITDSNIINCDVIVDGKNQYTGQIVGQNAVSAMGYGSSPTGGDPTGGEFPSVNQLEFFNKLINRGKLRVKGYRVQLKYYGNTLGKDFVLSSASFGLKGNDSTDIQDKI